MQQLRKQALRCRFKERRLAMDFNFPLVTEETLTPISAPGRRAVEPSPKVSWRGLKHIPRKRSCGTLSQGKKFVRPGLGEDIRKGHLRDRLAELPAQRELGRTEVLK